MNVHAFAQTVQGTVPSYMYIQKTNQLLVSSFLYKSSKSTQDQKNIHDPKHFQCLPSKFKYMYICTAFWRPTNKTTYKLNVNYFKGYKKEK